MKNKHFILLAAAFCVLFGSFSSKCLAQNMSFTALNYTGISGVVDFDYDSKGAVWALGGSTSTSDKLVHAILQKNGTNFQQLTGAGVRIAVASTDMPWVVNSAGNTFAMNQAGTWSQRLNNITAKDIAADAKGFVYVLDKANTVHKLNAANNSVTVLPAIFSDKPVSALDVDAAGNIWAFSEKAVFRFNGTDFEHLPLAASIMPRSISVSPAGEVWLVGNNVLYKFDGVNCHQKYTGAVAIAGAKNDDNVVIYTTNFSQATDNCLPFPRMQNYEYQMCAALGFPTHGATNNATLPGDGEHVGQLGLAGLEAYFADANQNPTWQSAMQQLGSNPAIKEAVLGHVRNGLVALANQL